MVHGTCSATVLKGKHFAVQAGGSRGGLGGAKGPGIVFRWGR